MRITIGSFRLAIAALIIAAVVATYIDAANTRTGSYPTIDMSYAFFQLVPIALILPAIFLLSGRRSPRWLPWFRGVVVTYTAAWVIMAVMLSGISISFANPNAWANVVTVVIGPIAIILDWILVADRPALTWRLTWVVMPLPTLGSIWLLFFVLPRSADLAPLILFLGLGLLIVPLLMQILVVTTSRLRLISVQYPDTLGVAVKSDAEARQEGVPA